MRAVQIKACVLAIALGLPAGAQDDRHLPVVPRTAAEAARIADITAPPTDFTAPQAFEALSAGAGTVPRTDSADAFSAPQANLGFAGEMDFKLGNGLFRKTWIAAPATTRASDGLGPLYNARACQDCHLKDGRGRVPLEGEAAVGLFLRVALPGGDSPAEIADWLATQGHPAYGGQIQTFAAPGQSAEGRLQITWTLRPVTLAGGEVVELRVPEYALADPAYGPLDAMLSPRIASPMIGLGLLEAIPAADILARADEGDADGDGISGRANLVPMADGPPMLGRFGWKAGSVSVRAQSAAALAGDMGLSNPLHPDPAGDCTAAQVACRAGPHGQEDGVRDGLEVDGQSLDLITFYAQNLGVPARAAVDDPQVLRGKQVFHAARCAACHVPAHVTNRLDGQPAQSFQLIWPYTDLLLHDMGPDLADGLNEGRATGTEWRTPSLWGIGLTGTVGAASYLHDGRARTLMEAVLWHGGEAQPARDAVVALPKPDRDALIAFLESL